MNELRAETQKNTSRIQLLEQKLEESADQNKRLMQSKQFTNVNNQGGHGLSIQNPHVFSDDTRMNKEGIGMGDYSDFNNNSQIIQNIN